jgi:hypothetical protein
MCSPGVTGEKCRSCILIRCTYDKNLEISSHLELLHFLCFCFAPGDKAKNQTGLKFGLCLHIYKVFGQ